MTCPYPSTCMQGRNCTCRRVPRNLIEAAPQWAETHPAADYEHQLIADSEAEGYRSTGSGEWLTNEQLAELERDNWRRAVAREACVVMLAVMVVGLLAYLVGVRP